MNKKAILILCLVIGFFLVLGVGSIFVGQLFLSKKEVKTEKYEEKEDSSIESIFDNKNLKEEKIRKELERIGIDFYEGFYYASLGEDAVSQVSKFRDVGIKVDLTSLSRYLSMQKKTDNIKELIEGTNGILCSSKETKVIFYPKEPYGKHDYTIKVNLSCTIE